MTVHIYNLTHDERLKATEIIDQLSQLTDYDEQAVLSILSQIGTDLFVALDESPGHWGYTATNGNEWHWLLRRARNNADGFWTAVAGETK